LTPSSYLVVYLVDSLTNKYSRQDKKGRVEAMASNDTKIPIDKLRIETDPNSFDFTTTNDLPDLEGLFKQARVMDALEISLHSSEKSFNLRVRVDGATGRNSAFMHAVRETVNSRPNGEAFKIYDYCMAHDPSNPDSPFTILLPKGQGEEFAADMAKLLKDLKVAIPQKMEEMAEVSSKEIWGEFDGELEQLGTHYNTILEQLGADYRIRLDRVVNPGDQNNPPALYVLPKVKIGDDGVIEEPFAGFIRYDQTVGVKDPQGENFRVVVYPVINNWLSAFSLDEDEKIDARLKSELLLAMERLAFKGSSIFQKATSEYSDDKTGEAMGGVFHEVARSLYEKYVPAKDFLDSVGNLVRESYGIFSLQHGQTAQLKGTNIDAFKVFEIYVFVDNKDLEDAAPIVFEGDPTFSNIVGRVVSHLSQHTQGGPLNIRGPIDLEDFEPGALFRANGGVLVIPVDNLLLQNDFLATWRFLVNAINNDEVVIEDYAERLGLFHLSKFKPRPIPVKLRVILLTSHEHDSAFSKLFPRDYKLFRRKAEFVSTTDRDEESELAVARFLGTSSRKNWCAALRQGGRSFHGGLCVLACGR